MSSLSLFRVDANNPDFARMDEMIVSLRTLLTEKPNPNNKLWMSNICKVIDFQDDDGSFRLLDSYEVPADARVDYCYIPSYLCSAILMKVYMAPVKSIHNEMETALIKSLRFCTGRRFYGHGYDGFMGQMEAIDIFREGSLTCFLKRHSHLCPEFSSLISEVRRDLKRRIREEDFCGVWGENNEEDIKRNYAYLSELK